MAEFHEQTVEIALGPKGAFENGTVGALKRRVRADRVVNMSARARRSARPPRQPRTPRVVELLRKAIEWRALIESGAVANQAALAQREGITRARVTQVMGLVRLAPEIQQHVRFLPDMIRRSAITERALRPISGIEDRQKQIAAFEGLATADADLQVGVRSPTST